jgi:hypothetical protein
VIRHIQRKALAALEPEQLYDLLSREWIGRIWTFQEFVLPWEATLICGQKSIRGTDFLLGVLAIYITSIPQNISETDHRGLQLSLNVWGRLACSWLNYSRPNIWGDISADKISVSARILADANERTSLRTLQKRARYAALSIVCLLHQAVFLPPFVLLRNSRSGAQIWYMFVYGPSLFIVLCWFWNSKARKGDTAPLVSSISSGIGRREEKKYVDIVPAMRERHATQPHDRVFALHGLLRGSGMTLRPPDYAEDTGIVFGRLFRDLVQWDKSFLKFIIDAGRLPEGVPTWIPDFNASRAWIDPGYFNGAIHRKVTAQAPFAQFRDNKLVVHGRLVSYVAHCCDKLQEIQSYTSADSLQHNTAAVLQWLRDSRLLRNRLVRSHLRWPMSDREVLNSLHAAFYAETDVRSNPYVHETSDSNPRFYEGFESWHRVVAEATNPNKNGRDRIRFESVATETARVLAKLQTDAAALDYFADRCNAMAGKRVLFTSNMNEIGSGPESMAAGDAVVIVAGVPLPMILRDADQEDSMTVVGAGYVAGSMDLDMYEGRVREIVLI